MFVYLSLLAFASARLSPCVLLYIIINNYVFCYNNYETHLIIIIYKFKSTTIIIIHYNCFISIIAIHLYT